MALIVQKYGGTSVATIERIQHIAHRVVETRRQGHEVIVVLSAMAGETDRLSRLAQNIMSQPTPRELDVLLATGEQVTIALLAMALQARHCPARSFTGSQVTILTDDAHNKARIERIDSERMRRHLNQGQVLVVAGFQGVDEQGNITTLGRGGSDTTAVALAAALKADECQIFTDVKGVYTADPRVVPNARLLASITFEEMLELASVGSKVLQIRSVEFAGKYRVPLRVLSSFEPGQGTLIRLDDEEISMEQPHIAGVAYSRDEAKITVMGVPDQPGIASCILGPIAAMNIEVDMIVQNVSQEGFTDFTFTVHRNDYDRTLACLQRQQTTLRAQSIAGNQQIVKVSLVGVGMRSHAGIASQMFAAFAQENINMMMISTSEIKISVVVDEKYWELAVRTLHDAFNLQHASPNP